MGDPKGLVESPAYEPLVLIPGHMALDTALGLSLELLKQSTPASIHVSWDQGPM